MEPGERQLMNEAPALSSPSLPMTIVSLEPATLGVGEWSYILFLGLQT